MNALELKVLKYINKKDTVSETDIINHFRRTSNIAIKGVLFVLQNQYDYIRESNSIYEITDKGQIEAISSIIEQAERIKERIIGFIFGIISGIIIGVVTGLLI